MPETKTRKVPAFKFGETRVGELIKPASAPLARHLNTPRSLSWLRALSVLAALLAMVVGVGAVNGADDVLTTSRQTVNDITNVRSFKAYLFDADALATKYLVDGQGWGEYLVKLEDAATDLARQENDEDASIALAKNLPRASAALGQLVKADSEDKRSDALHDSWSTLNSDLDVQSNKWIEELAGRLDAKSKFPAFTFAFLIVPFGVLIYASVRHAKLTRRVLNIGLVGAVVLVGASAYLVSVNSIKSVSLSSGGARFSDVRQASEANVKIAMASSTANRVLLHNMNNDGQADASEVRSLIEQAYDNGLHGESANAVGAFRESFEAALTDASAENFAQVNASAETAKGALGDDVKARLESFNEDAEAQLASNQRSRTLAVLLNVLAAISAGWGLSQPLRKYQR